MVVLLDEDSYNPLDYILENVNIRSIRLDENIRKECIKIATIVSSEIVREMRDCDEDFKRYFSRIDFIGSYYDGLKINQPTSFDMNLIMKLPLAYEDIRVDVDDDEPCFVRMYVRNAARISGGWIHKYITPDGYLLENKLRQWLESVIQRTLNRNNKIIEIFNTIYCLETKKDGPSFIVCVKSDPAIDIHFCFTIEFPSNIQSPFPKPSDYPWCVVSDTVKKNVYERSGKLWRISFPGDESKLIYAQYKLKYIIRFLKALKFAQPNLRISSYIITNLFLVERESNYTPRFWEKRTGYLFVYMLEKLYNALQKKSICYYWDRRLNLLRNHNTNHLENMEGQLRNIIRKINALLETGEHCNLEQYIFKLYT